jgi:hypothetical protein
VGQLTVNAIDARQELGFSGFLLALLRTSRWELTCGFCKEPSRRYQWLWASTVVCPYCGTRNRLPVPRFPSDPGPRPPGWP